MLFRRIGYSAIMFFAASSAFGAPAPDGMNVSKIEEGTYLQGMPSANTNYDPKKPMPTVFGYVFRGGKVVAPGQGLDENVTNSNDPRYVDGYMSCSATLGSPMMPTMGYVADRPDSGSATFEFESGKTLTLQKVSFTFSVRDQYGRIDQDTLVCYKVGTRPINVRDLKGALGPNFRIELSNEQSAETGSTDRMRTLLAGATPKIPYSNGQVDADGSANKPAGPSKTDGVVNRTTSGSFDGKARKSAD